ncbi:hypothetical protein RJ639_043865 [Escallonia herrerae]|uniref:Uncharacterized protein n=1 Tax=Escallonia herrerae TaxID=1293975 RepID=A0AA88WCP0_9ASTE|nr:hypothetical protein RJ639_043865 [Escallonia herrerae]
MGARLDELVRAHGRLLEGRGGAELDGRGGAVLGGCKGQPVTLRTARNSTTTNFIHAADAISFNETLTDGRTLVSSGQSFELGFFSPSGSRSNRYLGIWYKNFPDTPVWVANRESPVSHSFGVLTLSTDGVLRRGSVKTFRSGIWNGLRFSGGFSLTSTIYKSIFVADKDEIYYMFDLGDNSISTKVVVNQSGLTQHLIIDKGSSEWTVMYSSTRDACDNYGQCGANGICRSDRKRICECLAGYIPKSESQWAISDWSSGCTRRRPLDCQKGDGFVKLKNVKLPDLDFWHNESMNLEQCKAECLDNCSCMAVANLDIKGRGSGCIMWFGDLMDIRELVEPGSEQDMYIRMPASELGTGLCQAISILSKLAWLLWNEDKAIELMDSCLEDSYVESQVQACIQVGLLCVQKLPKDRPGMSSVVFMLGNEGVTLPEPQQPGFFIERSSIEMDNFEKCNASNAGTMTMPEAR